MFAKTCTLALLASLAAALQIEPLKNAHSQGIAEVKWFNEFGDSSRFSNFSLLLHHPSISPDPTLVPNQDASDSTVNVTLPLVPPQDGYTLRATDVGNTTHDFTVSPPFAIGPPEASPSSGASSGTGTGSSTAAQGTATNSNSNAGQRLGMGGLGCALGATVAGLWWVLVL
ncbi:hypothetical protein EYR40_004762 [Pleurotus pulmonarius]|nr:hypothetical protein EYR36_006863 [Pleurotus pulmonarius]KAF4601552.1 hypothetical protein EYR38_006206 [Pleurotus pulmonarius]KAF4601564.1 hypothetical protein EYR40_004762 [Pleurotus pulmonarius]